MSRADDPADAWQQIEALAAGPPPPPAAQQQKQHEVVIVHPNPAYTYRMLYELPTSPEILFQDQAALRTSCTDDFTICIGVSYLTGAAAGALEGLRRAAVEAERGESLKLRASRALNNCSSVGRSCGNRLGIIAMLFSGTRSAIAHYRSGADDWINTADAGVTAGALYRMPGGPRSAVVGGLVGGILAGAGIVAGRPLLRKFAPKLGI
ncbi:unnamed protein product [Urochloa humidicola]